MGGVCERPCRCEIRVRVLFPPKSRRIEGVEHEGKNKRDGGSLSREVFGTVSGYDLLTIGNIQRKGREKDK